MEQRFIRATNLFSALAASPADDFAGAASDASLRMRRIGM
jgi:hypothetical protein